MSLPKKIRYALAHPDYLMRRIIHVVHRMTNYDTGMWVRVAMYRELFEYVRGLHPETLSVLEIGANPEPSVWSSLGFAKYEGAEHSHLDICEDRLDREFDIIIADQVFEHLLWPYRAARNVHAMLSVGGKFINTTPFLIPVHDCPVDCSRWTEIGMKHLLAEAGFELEKIKTGSWGTLACVRANLTHLGISAGWEGILANEPQFPVTVWAIAEK